VAQRAATTARLSDRLGLDDATTGALLASPHLANTRLWLQGKVIAKRAGS
jgi:hypothetical protein